MCTLLIYRNPKSDWPVVIATNRDEYYERKFRPPAYHWKNKSIFAGKDKKKGGSWLGVNSAGVCVCILNRKNKEVKKINKSRGLLVLRALEKNSALSAKNQVFKIIDSSFYNFNLFITDKKNAYWIKYEHNLIQSFLIPYGFSILDNYDLNDNKSNKQKDYLKYFKKKAFPSLDLDNSKEWRQLLLENFGSKKYPIFIKSKKNGYGTVSSSIIGLNRKKNNLGSNILWLYNEKGNYNKNFSKIYPIGGN